MGYRIIADLAGLKVKQQGARVTIDDPDWGGYLANLAPAEFQEKFAAHLPESLQRPAAMLSWQRLSAGYIFEAILQICVRS